MEEMNEGFIDTSNSDEDDSEDNSDSSLKIDIDSPKKIKTENLTEIDRDVFASIEDEIERRLEEKAAKTKLNVINVKNIIKQVVSNEYMLALVRKAENPSNCEDSVPVFEPKLTRAKAKELAVPTVPVAPAPWESPEPASEVQVLLTEDLQEDDSGEEYVPGEEGGESEEDGDSTTFSNPPSVEPPTPPSLEPPPTPPCLEPLPTPPPVQTAACTSQLSQTNWTEDGVFKIPWTKEKEDTPDEATIAKRTRSQLSLSSTPLEVIEEAFIPPDITTDMYDMYCDNDDWVDFLKKFTRPLEEVEDEEQDPDFNILADEEIDKPDRDEFRVDKAVKIPRRELNKLIEELLDGVDFDMGDQNQTEGAEKAAEPVENNESPVDTYQIVEANVTAAEDVTETVEEPPGLTLNESEIPLLELIEQQMRQHVQMLTQNFILTYEHPELHHYSIQMKEYLLNLKYLAEGKRRSMFHASNLADALKLLEYWENLLAENNDDVKEMKKHIRKEIAQCIHAHKTGNVFIVSFPKLVMDTILDSSVFLYPWLLPKIPFRTPKIFMAVSKFYTDSEDQLIAQGLEQFYSAVTEDNKKKSLKKSLDEACDYIVKYMMPYKRPKYMATHIKMCRLNRCAKNPIKFFFKFDKAPTSVQFVTSLEQLQVLPPRQRHPEELPHQWKNYVLSKCPNPPGKAIDSQTTITAPPIIITSPQEIFPVNVVQVLDPYLRPILPKGVVTINTIQVQAKATTKKKKPPPKKGSTNNNNKQKPTTVSTAVAEKQKQTKKNKCDPITNFVKCLCRSSSVDKIGYLYSVGPSLLQETDEPEQENDNEGYANVNDTPTSNRSEILLDLTMLPSMPNICTPIKRAPVDEEEPGEEVEKKPVPLLAEKRNVCLEFSTISSSSFQQPNATTEVEFCTQETSTGCNINQTGEMDQMEIDIKPVQFTETVYTAHDYSSKDNLDDINALMTASTSSRPMARKEPSGAEKRKAKRKREYLSNLLVSTPEDRDAEKQKNESFALAYYDKMRETLELPDYHKIMQILNDYEEGDAVDLYKQVDVVLRPKYSELADEFLLFLREKEAAAVDRLIPWIRMNNRSKFLRKLEIYFKDHPAQLRRIYKCLAELSQTIDVNTEMIKNTLLPMFKGNEVLSDLFLQNFLDEPPPPSLLEGPYEEMDIAKEMSKPDDEEPFETITVPDAEDKYGGSSCICACHEIEDSEFQSRYRHCTKCGTRFINGRVYLQTGKGPRPATVTFLNSSNTDQNVRLMGKSAISMSQRKKRSDNSPSKQVASYPSKENIDEETDEDGDTKKKTKKRPQKRLKKTPDKSPDKSPEHKRARKGSISKKPSPQSNKSSNKDLKPCGRKRANSIKKAAPEAAKTAAEEEKGDAAEEGVATKVGANPGQLKRLAADEASEWGEQSAAGESSCDVKVGSPDQQTADSESEFCESSQDNCESDSNSSVASSNNPDDSYRKLQEDNSSWKREEDKVILEVFQQENDKDNAFKMIALQLTDRTVDEIKSRFETLMNLLLETIGN